MNRLTISIPLQDQHAPSFRVVGIVFDDDCSCQTLDDVADQDTVRSKFLITVIGHTNIAASHERADLLESLAQCLDPFFVLIIRSGVGLVPLTLRAEPRAVATG